MSNLHAAGLAPIPTQPTRVDHLRAGDRILYAGRLWIVHDVLPVVATAGHGNHFAVSGPMAVVASTEYAPHERAALPFAHPGACAELVVTP